MRSGGRCPSPRLPPLKAAVETRGPTTSRRWQKYGRAMEFLERGDVAGSLQRAAALLRSAVGRDPGFALAWARLGEAYWETYKRTSEPKWATEAVNATNKALTLDQRQPEVWISLARIHDGTGRREDALSDLNKALATAARQRRGASVDGTGAAGDGPARRGDGALPEGDRAPAGLLAPLQHARGVLLLDRPLRRCHRRLHTGDRAAAGQRGRISQPGRCLLPERRQDRTR